MSSLPQARQSVPHRGAQTLHVIDIGAGAPVVLLHGLGSLAAEMVAPLGALAGAFHVIAPDRPGYGASTYRLGNDSRWFAGMLRARGIRRPIIVAHSIGAITALRFALDHPSDVSGLVLVAPFCKPTKPAGMPLLRLAVAPLIGGFVRRHVLPRMLRRLARDKMSAVFAPEAVTPSMRRVPIEQAVRPDAPLAMARDLRHFNAHIAAIGQRAGRLTAPVIILAGTDDAIIDSPTHAAWLASRVPEAAVVKITGAGHMVHHTHANIVMNAVRMLGRRSAWIGGQVSLA